MIKALQQKLQYGLRHLTKRFITCIIEQPHEIELCHRIRRQVFCDELKRVLPGKIETPGMPDILDIDSIFIGCKERATNKIVGYCRLTKASIVRQYEYYPALYKLHHFPSMLDEKILVLSRLVALKAYRNQLIGLDIATACYQYGAQHGFTIGVITCEPEYYFLYEKLGYRPLDSIYESEFGGYRIPLYMMGHDFAYLKKLKSPLLRVAKQLKLKPDAETVAWYHAFTKTHNINTKISKLDNIASINDCQILNGVSKKSQQQFLQHGIILECSRGETIIKQHSSDHYFGYIKHGQLTATIDSNIIYELHTGEIFGETNYALNLLPSTNIVVHSDHARVVIFRLTALSNISNHKDRAIIWHNIARTVAHKLANTCNKHTLTSQARLQSKQLIGETKL